MNATSRGLTATFLTAAIERSGRSQIEIARDLQLPRPNVISMMKSGEMKVPITRIPDLARACGCDPKAFLRVALEEYHAEVWAVIQATFGDLISDTERELLTAYRLSDPTGVIEFDFETIEALTDLLVDLAVKLGGGPKAL